MKKKMITRKKIFIHREYGIIKYNKNKKKN
jgi:hypothetical protein